MNSPAVTGEVNPPDSPARKGRGTGILAAECGLAVRDAGARCLAPDRTSLRRAPARAAGRAALDGITT
jgi:hypothetical protein